MVNADGSRTVVSEAKQALGRVSVVDGRNNAVIIDDYVLSLEPVVDHKTRFSGLVGAPDHTCTWSQNRVILL